MDFTYNIFSTALTVIVSSIVGGSIGGIVTAYKSNKKNNESLENAVRALTHDAFFRYCRYLIDTGYLDTTTLENLEHLYESYKSLGLNGTGDRLMEECRKLPLK